MSNLPILPRAFPPAPCAPGIRERAEDFRVFELALHEPSGEGQHVWLEVEKVGCNTEWVARTLASFAGVQSRDVGFAGMKDRNAVTTQWFSVDLKGAPEPDWEQLNVEGVTIKVHQRHRSKLRRGALEGNRFEVTLRALGTSRQGWLATRLELIGARGVPNYFGPQRFGHDGSNLAAARMLFADKPVRSRHKRGIYLSAARAEIFNRVLARRVALGSWAIVVPGDALIAPGNARAFLHHRCREAQRGELEWGLTQGAIHPSGPLWGKGNPTAVGYARELEISVAETYSDLADGLVKAGLTQERRALRVVPAGIEVRWLEPPYEADAVVSFSLPKGSYATAVLRELSCEEAR